VLGDGPADAAERRRADEHCDNIAQEMWQDYYQELVHRGVGGESLEGVKMGVCPRRPGLA